MEYRFGGEQYERLAVLARDRARHSRGVTPGYFKNRVRWAKSS